MSTRIKAAIGIGVVAILAVVIWASIARKDKNTVRVTTAKVGKVPLVSTVSCNGRVRAKTKVDISSQVMGQIVTLAVREGDHVKKGDLLLQIDKAQYDAARRRRRPASTRCSPSASPTARRASRPSATTRASRRTSRRRSRPSRRSRRRSSRSTRPPRTRRATERRIEQARANLMGNKDSLRKTTLTSPIDGVVTAQPGRAGRERHHRDDEQPRHRAPDRVGHVDRRGRDGGRRDRRPAREGRPEGDAHVRRVRRTRSSRGRSRRSAAARSRSPRSARTRRP